MLVIRNIGGNAARCFLKSAAILEKNDERLSASKDYVEAGQCLIKNGDPNYAKCYLSAIELYEKSGYFGQSGKLYRTIADMYLSVGDYKNAIQFYKKSADSFSLDEYSKSNYSQVIIAYAELISQYNESYYEAAKIFEDEAKKALSNNLLQYGAKTILFKAGLLSLVSGDVDNGQIVFEKYIGMDNRFQHSREAHLLAGIIESLNNKDVEFFNKSVSDYEQIALISAWEKHIINIIKLKIFGIQPVKTNTTSVVPSGEDEGERMCLKLGGYMESLGVWTVHTVEDGRKYYYNTQTKKSQWNKPDELLTPEEQTIAKSTSWQEFTAADGRRYWYNKDTKESSWEMPNELKILKDLLAQQMLMHHEYGYTEKIETKDQAKEELFKYFQEKGINHKSVWDSAVKIFEADPKWNCFSMLTRGEKKQIFNDFIVQKQKGAQGEERKKRQKAREIILNEISTWEDLSPESTYIEFAANFHKSDWWNWLEEKERDNIFQDFLQNNMERAKEMRRRKRKQAKSHFATKLKDFGDGVQLERWENVKKYIEEDEMFKYIDLDQALDLWIDEAKRREKLELGEIDKKEYTIFRKNRDVFREYLKKSNVNLETKWSDFLEICRGHPAYKNMVGQPGSACWQIFADYISVLRKNLYDDRDFVVKLVGDAKIDNVESLSKLVKGKREISYENLIKIYDWLQSRKITGDTSDIESDLSEASL